MGSAIQRVAFICIYLQTYIRVPFQLIKRSVGSHCAEVLHIPALDASKVIPAGNFCLLSSKAAKIVNPVLDTDLPFVNSEVRTFPMELAPARIHVAPGLSRFPPPLPST